MKTPTPAESEEPAASLTGRARNDARHALRVLSEAADSGDEAELPPLPEHIRDQWQEAYGQTAPAKPMPAAAPEGWITRLAGLLRSPRFVWGSGLAAAAAVVVIMLQQPDNVTTSGGGGQIVTRGGNHGTATGTAEGLVVIGPANESAALMAELARAFPARSIERMESAPVNAASGAIIIDTAAKTIRRGTDSTPLTDVSPDAVIMAIESLDELEPR